MNATMPRPKGSKIPQAKSEEPNEVEAAEAAEKSKEMSLKVDHDEGSLVGLVASHRGVSVKKLFKMKDVNDFFAHLLLEEMRLKTERLNKPKQ